MQYMYVMWLRHNGRPNCPLIRQKHEMVRISMSIHIHVDV